MGLKRTKGKDGQDYYFEDGKRVSEDYYKLHWYEGGKGRMGEADFQEFYSSLPDGIDLDTARVLQNNYFEESRGLDEIALLEQKEQTGDVRSEFIPHYAMSPYSDQADKIYVKTDGTAGFQRVSDLDAIDIINEQAREANFNQKNTGEITLTRVYSEYVDGELILRLDYTEELFTKSG